METTVCPRSKASSSGRPSNSTVKPAFAGRCRVPVLRTVAVAAVDTKKQSRLSFVDLQPPDPILGARARSLFLVLISVN